MKRIKPKNLKEIMFFAEKHNLTLQQLVEGEQITGNLYLESLTTLPDNITFNVGGNLYLESLTTLPDNITFNVGGNLDLESLTTLPDNITFNVGGDLYLESLTTLPENTTFNVGGSLYLDSMTTLPENTYYILNGVIFESNGKKYIKADNILSEIVSRRNNVYHVRIFGSTKTTVLITDGENWSHGETLKEAKDDLIYKITDRKKSDYESYDLQSVLNFEEAVKCYRTITGACSQGTKNFVKTIHIKKQYTISEIIKLTMGQYGNRSFSDFFNN